MKVIALLSVFLIMVGASVGMASAQTNEPPVANDFTVEVPYDTTVVIDHAPHVSDDDPVDSLTIQILRDVQPDPGGFATTALGNFISYTPTADGAPINGGVYTLEYRVADSDGRTSNPAVITLNIGLKPNTGPPEILAPGRSEDVNAGESVTINMVRFVNDPDVDRSDREEELVLTISQPPQKGNVTVDGLRITYTANADESGQDTIGYTVTDPAGPLDEDTTINGTVVVAGTVTSQSVDDTITINITPAAPVTPVTLTAVDDGASVPQDSNVNIAVLNNDSIAPAGTTVTVGIVTDATSGTTVVNSDNSVTYTPNSGFSGTDTFTYQITGGGETSNTATVTITVVPPVTENRNPVAQPTALSVRAGESVMVDLADRTSDPDNDPLTITITGEPSQGTYTFSNNVITYTANDNAAGTDTITYTVSDGQGGSATGTITITITDLTAPSRVCAR